MAVSIMARVEPLPVGVVLAGGESTRLGRDKALLRPGGRETLLEHALATLGAAGLVERAVSVSSPERAAALRESIPALAGVSFVVDVTPGRGPLAGLHAALTCFPGRSIVLVACDMPGLDPVALRLLLAYPDADVVIPCPGGRAQPLHARYGLACRPAAARLLAEGRLAMRDLLTASGLRVVTLDDALLARHGVSPAAFDNVNTAADLAALADREG